MNPYSAELAAADHRRKLVAEAAHQRLVAQATCCRPTALARAVTALRGLWDRLTRAGSTPCCATA